VDVARVRPDRVGRDEQVGGDLRRAQVGRQIFDDTHLCCATSPTSASTAPTITIDAETDSFVIIHSCRPIGEPVVFGGPFLMSTDAEKCTANGRLPCGPVRPDPRRPYPPPTLPRGANRDTAEM
jgi:hypothetical protein